MGMENNLRFFLRVFGLWIVNIFVALDQLAAALLGFDPDETLSSIIGKKKDKYMLAKKLACILDTIDPNHTEKYKEMDEGKHSIWRLIYNRNKE
jgi:hypothetical protein